MKYSIMLASFCLTTFYFNSAKALDAPDGAGNYICSNQNQALIFTVRFNAAYENGLIIKEAKSRRNAMTFNNYY